MWDALKAIHEKHDEVSKARWNAQYWNFRIDQKEPMSEAIARFTNIVPELTVRDEKISVSNMVSRIIDALPQDYASFASAWDSTAPSERTFENLCQRLLVEEERRGLFSCQ